MRFLVLSCLVASIAVQGIPVEKTDIKRAAAVCTKPLQRKAWHTLTPEEKTAYIAAEKCLMNLPPKLGLPDARNRFDEFQMMHVLETRVVHGVGAFLPFHRLYIHAHEQALRTECSYPYAQPYWDEPLDAGNFSTSVVLSPTTGFGGNGDPSNNSCISDGPFKDYVNVIGPGEVNTKHCIDRRVDDCVSRGAAREEVERCMGRGTYVDVWACLEGVVHAAGHGGVGGQMMNVFSSPGDPLFYLHHAYLDKLWWTWQLQNLSTRLTDMGGQNVAPFLPGFPPGGNFTGPFPFPFPTNGSIPGLPGGNGTCSGFPFPGFPPGFGGGGNGTGREGGSTGREGDPGNVTTLGHVLTVHGYLPDTTVGEVMDVQGGLLCYEYV